ncbi:MAG TPA: ABC transporter ATP-binding protein [Steroidobacteraceae bacterium]
MAVARTLIELRGAGFRFGEHTVFSGIDLDIYAGEVLTVLGPNGCGKSTLLRCIGGALALAAGSARIDGIEIASLDPAARARRIGFLFQQHAPSFPFTVLEVVTMGRTPYLGLFGAPSAKDVVVAKETLERVGLGELRDRPYTGLSGGERALVLLARTLAQQPDLILLDEPTSHLDFRNQVIALRTIGALAAQGVTMITTTHDPNHAFLLPGRALLMSPHGAMVTGPASEVITDRTLSATYGIDISVFAVSRREQPGELRFCSPW